jgi:hypothetical protein
MYYNWVGSVKVPAPIQYANKLSNLVAEKFEADFKPHSVLGQNSSLYFIWFYVYFKFFYTLSYIMYCLFFIFLVYAIIMFLSL